MNARACCVRPGHSELHLRRQEGVLPSTTKTFFGWLPMILYEPLYSKPTKIMAMVVNRGIERSVKTPFAGLAISELSKSLP